MPQSPQVTTQMLSWRLHAMLAGALLLLAGCAANGDFGEVKPSLVRDDIHDWVALDATAGINTWPSRFELTDDERQLRDLSYPLIEAPYHRQQPYSIAGEYGVIGSDHRTDFDRTTYVSYLMSARHRSPSSRYAQLIEDMRNDVTRLPQFFETAARVFDIDAKRRKSFAYISSISENERSNALRRINENASIIRMVQGSLSRRVASYRFALERLVIMTPSPQAVEAEQVLNQLKASIAMYRNGAPTGRSPNASFGIGRT